MDTLFRVLLSDVLNHLLGYLDRLRLSKQQNYRTILLRAGIPTTKQNDTFKLIFLYKTAQQLIIIKE
jgi:hypothetical protein